MAMKSIPPEPGAVYGRWTVIGGHRRQNHARSKSGYQTVCQCACGTKRWVLISALRRGGSLSCGCLAKEKHTHFLQRRQALPKSFTEAA